MAEGYRDWVALEQVTAALLEEYLQLQAVMRFASAAARDTALSSVLTEGLPALLKDANSLSVYTGSAWSTVGPVYGALTTWTPAVTQLTSVTSTNTQSRYSRLGRDVYFYFHVVATSAGTAAQPIYVSLPVACAHAADMPIGRYSILDTSSSTYILGDLTVNTSTTIGPIDTANANRGIAGITLASGDVLRGWGQFEANGDA